jgi:hypothetical protein
MGGTVALAICRSGVEEQVPRMACACDLCVDVDASGAQRLMVGLDVVRRQRAIGLVAARRPALAGAQVACVVSKPRLAATGSTSSRTPSSSTPESPIQIAPQRQTDGWQITVADSGIGTDPQDDTRIFEMPSRLHSQDAYPGTGIGLAVCHASSNFTRGSITVAQRRHCRRVEYGGALASMAKGVRDNPDRPSAPSTGAADPRARSRGIARLRPAR